MHRNRPDDRQRIKVWAPRRRVADPLVEAGKEFDEQAEIGNGQRQLLGRAVGEADKKRDGRCRRFGQEARHVDTLDGFHGGGSGIGGVATLGGCRRPGNLAALPCRLSKGLRREIENPRVTEADIAEQLRALLPALAGEIRPGEKIAAWIGRAACAARLPAARLLAYWHRKVESPTVPEYLALTDAARRVDCRRRAVAQLERQIARRAGRLMPARNGSAR